jgi:predicted glycosyltransferase
MDTTTPELINAFYDNVLMHENGNVYVFSKNFGVLTLERRREVVNFQSDFTELLGYQFQEKGKLIFVHPPGEA